MEIYAAIRHFVFIEGEESLGPRPTWSVGEANGGHSRRTLPGFSISAFLA